MDFIDSFELIVKDLKRHEGTGPKKRGRFLPYKDSEGILTIGYGINLDDGLYQDEVESLLDHRINMVMSTCRSKFAPWWYTLDDVRQHVLINMVYNMGMPRVLKFKKMLKAIKKKDWEEAEIQMLDSKWSRQVKGRAKELAKRMRTGER